MFIMVILGYFMNEQNVIPEQWLGATGNVGRLQKKLKVWRRFMSLRIGQVTVGKFLQVLRNILMDWKKSWSKQSEGVESKGRG